MLDNIPEVWKVAGILLAPGGLAAGAVKLVLNGSAGRIKETHADVKMLRTDFAQHLLDDAKQFGAMQRSLGRIEGRQESDA